MLNSLSVSENAEKNISVFENSEFGTVRTAEINGKIHFCGSDVAKALGYSNPRDAILKHCRYVTKCDAPHPQSKNKTIEMSFIPEGDVYRLIVSSKLPTAQKFESWVFDEVIPSIRSNGGYIDNQENLSDYEIMAKGLLVAQKIIAEKNQKLLEMAPKAEFYDKVTGSTDTHDMKEVAKILNFKNIGRNILFEILRNGNVLDRNNQPYQKYVDAGYFRIIESKWEDKDGDTHINLKTVVYQKGVDYIRKLVLKNSGYLENAVESAAENWIKEND